MIPCCRPLREGCSRHCDGWGYVIHADNGLFHYRTSRPVYEDDAVLPQLQGEIRAIFHGRFASDPDLSGHIFAHPFMAANRGEVMFLAHNGGVDPDPSPERIVDSEWALEEIIRHGNIAAALPKLKQHTRTALNLLLLTIGRGKDTPASLQYFHYFKPTEPDKAAYYQLFLGSMPGGRALVSSTFKVEGAKAAGLSGIHPADFDALKTLG